MQLSLQRTSEPESPTSMFAQRLLSSQTSRRRLPRSNHSIELSAAWLPNYNCTACLSSKIQLLPSKKLPSAGRTLVEKFDIEPFSQPNHQTLEGSFSAVSTPNFATKASFFSIFRDLQDLQSFAPLRSPKFSKKLQKFCRFSNGSNGSIVRRSNLST